MAVLDRDLVVPQSASSPPPCWAYPTLTGFLAEGSCALVALKMSWIISQSDSWVLFQSLK